MPKKVEVDPGMAKQIFCDLPQRTWTSWYISQDKSVIESWQLNVWHVREQSLWFWSCFLPRRPLREENSSGYSQLIYLQAERIEFLYVSTKWAGNKLVMAWKAEWNYSVLKQSKNSDLWAKEHWNAVLFCILSKILFPPYKRRGACFLSWLCL